ENFERQKKFLESLPKSCSIRMVRTFKAFDFIRNRCNQELDRVNSQEFQERILQQAIANREDPYIIMTLKSINGWSTQLSNKSPDERVAWRKDLDNEEAVFATQCHCHPHFFNQLSCGLDLVSMAGEWLTATANTNMFTYEIAPVFILMETVVMTHMREIIGKGWAEGDSIFAPGGSISNLYAFLAARHKMFPQYKEKGINALPGQLVMFTSDQSHYSIKSCASVCGLGTDNCVMVPTDIHGRLIPAELERLILERKAKGHIPFFVNATSGTTVLGAFDPISEIADICDKYNMWLHVDAAWGGGLLLSKKYRHPRLTGIERFTLETIKEVRSERRYRFVFFGIILLESVASEEIWE
ncbi:hypothetical protein ILUMI_13053, partial [Ignelater luminosus]